MSTTSSPGDETAPAGSPLTPISPILPAFVFDTPDLTQPDDFSDVTLLVEGRRLFTCRGILASASPVWRKMFTSDFKEKDASEIPLPGKSFTEVHELLLCISPAIQKPITGECTCFCVHQQGRTADNPNIDTYK